MDAKAPKKRGRLHAGTCESASEAIEIASRIVDPPPDGKDAPEKFGDPWLRARINYLNHECAQRDAGRVAHLFLSEARIRYRQFFRSGCPRLRYLCWSACNVVSNQLLIAKPKEGE
jgi:hypothetical protein